MHVLITGGTGLIGTALVQSLLNGGHTAAIVSRTPGIKIPGAKVISWDLENLISEINTVDAVVNLAGSSLAGNNPLAMRWTNKRKDQITSSRINVGAILTEALKAADQKPEVLIQASAIGFYGNQGDGQVDENSSEGNDFLASVCQSWEKSTSSIEELGIRRIIARIGLVLSREGGLLPLLALPFHLFFGGRIGSGNQFMSWIHISDVVKSLEYFLKNPQIQGVFNITAPQPVTNQDFAAQLSETLQKTNWFHLPPYLLKVLLGEASTLALDGREVLPRRLLETGFQFEHTQLGSALIDIYNQGN